MSIEKLWYSRNALAFLLLPLSLIFWILASLRRLFYRLGLLKTYRFPVPIIIVGNITVGGTGKTPLVIWLAQYLKSQGYNPGIIARGYGGKASNWPQQVRPDSDPTVVGDEAVLLAQRTECPVCVGPDRPQAVKALLAYTDCDIIISDDGLQHYALQRDAEIVVLDGSRRYGNGFLLPAGPLREPASRLRSVDLVITNGSDALAGTFSLRMRQPEIFPIKHPARAQPLGLFQGRRVHAVAGIGNPDRFFKMLRKNGLIIEPHPFPDHHRFTPEDLVFKESYPVLMTEKDAVKCSRFAAENQWVVRIEAQPDAAFLHRVNLMLKDMDNGQKAT